MNFQYAAREKIDPGGTRLRWLTGDSGLEDLAHSIKENGLLSPLGVSRKEPGYRIIYGERRLAALDILGWKEIPVIILETGGEGDALIKGIVENQVRLNLLPIERAFGIRDIIDTYGYSTDELARRLGRSKAYLEGHLDIPNRLHPRVVEMVREGLIAFGHAKALMQLADREKQIEIAGRIIEEDLPIKDTRIIVDQARPVRELTDKEKELNEIERDIMRVFPAEEWRERVNIRQGKQEEILTAKFSNRGELKDFAMKLLKAIE